MSKFTIVCPSCGADPYVNEKDGCSYLAKTCPKCGANVFDFKITPMIKTDKKEKSNGQ